jgi:hypothetical protein
MTFMSVEGIYKDGKVQLTELPEDVPDGAKVIVTFLAPSLVLMEHGINEAQAAELHARLRTFAEDWDSPEMAIYDQYDGGC